MKCINKKKEELVKRKINLELTKLKFNFNSLGTQYLIDAIYLLYSLKMYYKFNLEQDVYPAIANKYGDTSSSIKGAIIYAIDKMYYDCDVEYLQSYLKNNEYMNEQSKDLKPGPKRLMRAVLKRIKDI